VHGMDVCVSVLHVARSLLHVLNTLMCVMCCAPVLGGVRVYMGLGINPTKINAAHMANVKTQTLNNNTQHVKHTPHCN